MCLAVPGKITKIEGGVATIDYGSEKKTAKIVDGNYKVGDFVLVQGKVLIEKVSKEQITGWLELLNEVQNDRFGG